MSALSGGDDEPSLAEWAVTAVSVAVTLVLFGFVAWHGATAPASGAPEATVVGTGTFDDGRVAVRIAVYNPARTGLESVTVSADCANASLTFEHVPTDDRRTGTVACPAGTDDPSATLRSWIRVGNGADR